MAAIDRTYIKSYAQYKEIADWCKAQGTVTDTFGNTFTPYDYIPHMWKYEDDVDIDLGEYTEEYINIWLDNVRKANERYKTEEEWKRCLDVYSNDTEYQEICSTFKKYCKHIDDCAEIPLWNTDHVFDIYLIKNCPVEFIQNRLKEQYGGGWTKEAFTGNSNSYDAIKNGTSIYDTYKRNGVKNPHFSITHKINPQFKDDNILWDIDVTVGKEYWCYDKKVDYWYSHFECYMPKDDTCSSASYYDYSGNMSYHRIRRILNKWNLPIGATVEFCGFYKEHIIKQFSVKIKE